MYKYHPELHIVIILMLLHAVWLYGKFMKEISGVYILHRATRATH